MNIYPKKIYILDKYLCIVSKSIVWQGRKILYRIVRLLYHYTPTIQVHVQIWSWNNFQSSESCDLHLWPFEPKIIRGHPSFTGSISGKFLDYRCNTGSNMVWKPFSIYCLQWPWPLTPKLIGVILDSWETFLASFMIICAIQAQIWSGNHFQSSESCDLDLLTPKSIGLILDSWETFLASFMIIGAIQAEIWSGNHFQSSESCDLDLWPFDPKINRAHPWLMVSKCMKFHCSSIFHTWLIVRKPIVDALPPYRQPRRQHARPSHIKLRAEFCNSAKNLYHMKISELPEWEWDQV